jgi:hypothetical protein
MAKFSSNVMNCCESGSGECTATGTPVYLPNWLDQKCEERDSTLVSDWETNWVSYSIEECCAECEYFENWECLFYHLEVTYINTYLIQYRLET